VGLTEDQSKALPENILPIPRTNSMEALAQIYTAADVYVSPSVEETFGMTAMEALNCGTHAIVYKGTACEEIAETFGGTVVDRGPEHLYQAIMSWGSIE
jgi:glycosyltransferase involved in cell wall biosynthesis